MRILESRRLEQEASELARLQLLEQQNITRREQEERTAARAREVNNNREYHRVHNGIRFRSGSGSEAEGRALRQTVENLRYRVLHSGPAGLRDSQRDLERAQQRLRDWQNPGFIESRRRTEEQQNTRVPEQHPPRTIRPSIGIPKLPRQRAGDGLMASVSTDIITFEDMTVEKYLGENKNNMIIFESSFKPHFTNNDDLGVAMEDGIVYGCKKVSTRVIQSPENVDTGTELFNARIVGPISGYINANNLISAMEAVKHGQSSRMFLIKENVRTVPAVISKKLFNNMDSQFPQTTVKLVQKVAFIMSSSCFNLLIPLSPHHHSHHLNPPTSGQTMFFEFSPSSSCFSSPPFA